uniref:Uncharacterized protein n=1 Tax=Cacopsylla melanoneura TaxID=428564 RepID=A0A8D9E2H9_9HEMI
MYQVVPRDQIIAIVVVGSSHQASTIFHPKVKSMLPSMEVRPPPVMTTLNRCNSRFKYIRPTPQTSILQDRVVSSRLASLRLSWTPTPPCLFPLRPPVVWTGDPSLLPLPEFLPFRSA